MLENEMLKRRQSRWPCRCCAKAFTTRNALRIHLQHDKAREIGLLADLRRTLPHAQYQLSDPDLETSDSSEKSSEEDNDQSIALSTENTVEGTSTTRANLRCPDAECLRKKKSFATRSSLQRHYTSHFGIDVVCLFCEISFSRLRQFVTHPKQCHVKRDAAKDKEKLRREAKCKESSYEESNEQLQRQLSIVGSEDQESSVVGAARSYTDSGCGEAASIDSEPLADRGLLPAKEHRPLQKRRRMDTGTQSNQSHQVHEGDSGRPTNEFGVSVERLLEDLPPHKSGITTNLRKDIENQEDDPGEPSPKGSTLSAPVTASVGFTGILMNSLTGTQDTNRPAENSHLSTSGSSNTDLTSTTYVPTPRMPSQTVRNLHPEDLFSFLKEYHGGCAPLAIQLHPYDPSLLPSIEVKFDLSDRPDVKILLANETCRALLDHVIKNGKSELEFGL